MKNFLGYFLEMSYTGFLINMDGITRIEYEVT